MYRNLSLGAQIARVDRPEKQAETKQFEKCTGVWDERICQQVKAWEKFSQVMETSSKKIMRIKTTKKFCLLIWRMFSCQAYLTIFKYRFWANNQLENYKCDVLICVRAEHWLLRSAHIGDRSTISVSYCYRQICDTSTLQWHVPTCVQEARVQSPEQTISTQDSTPPG